MMLRDGRDCVVYVAILVICCDVAVALRMISCMCCFHCSCLCSVIPRYLYVSTMAILNDDKVSVNDSYAFGSVCLMQKMIICVLDDENVTFHVDAHILSLSSVACMCCITGMGLLLINAADAQITMSSANIFMCMYTDSMSATKSWM